jgi:hypothetical protein
LTSRGAQSAAQWELSVSHQADVAEIVYLYINLVLSPT